MSDDFGFQPDPAPDAGFAHPEPTNDTGAHAPDLGETEPVVGPTTEPLGFARAPAKDDFGFKADPPPSTADLAPPLARWLAANDGAAPDHRAQVLRYSAASGLPPDIVEANLDDVRRKVDAQRIDWDALAKRQPGLAKFLTATPSAVPVVKDDTEALHGMEWGLTGRFEWATADVGAPGTGGLKLELPYPRWIPPAWAAAVRDAFTEQRIGLTHAEAALGLSDPYAISEAAAAREKLSRNHYGANELPTGQRILARALLAPFQMAPYLGSMVVAGEIGPVAGLALNLEQALGQTHEALSASGVDEGAARPLAIGASLLEAPLLQFGLGPVVKGVAKPFLEDAGAAAITRALSSPSVARSVGRAAAQYGGHLALGAATMAAQAGITEAAREVGVDGSLDPGAVGHTMAQAFTTALPDFLLLAGTGPLHDMIADVGRARASRAEAAQLDAFVKAATDSRVAERAPEQLKALLAQMGVDGAADRIYIAKDAWDAHWQKQGTDPRGVAARLLGDAGRAYDEATAHGGDIVVPATQAVDLARAQGAAPLWKDARLSPDSLSIRDLQASEEAQQKRLADLAKAPPDPGEVEATAIYERERARARAAGQTEGAADAFGRFRSAMARVAAERYGGTPAEWHARFGQLELHGRGGSAPAEALTQGATLDPNAPEASRVLTERYHRLSPEERVGEFYRDRTTGLLNRRGFEALPVDPARPMVGHVSVEGVKYLNDTASHDRADELYRMVGKALGDAGVPAAKVGGDFLVRVRDQRELDQVLGKVREALPVKGFDVTGVAKREAKAAQEAHGTVKQKLEESGVRAARGAKPFGLGEDATGLTFPQDRAEAPIPDSARAAHAALTPTQAFNTVYTEPSTGLLSEDGWNALRQERPKAHVASVDLNGLKAINRVLGEAWGDELLQRFGQFAARAGGHAFDFAHLHGDEYAAQHDDPQQLRAFLDTLRAVSENVGEGGSDERTSAFGYGIGRDLDEADRALNADKQRLTAEGKRGPGADARRVERLRAGTPPAGEGGLRGERPGVGAEGRAADAPGVGRQAYAGVRGGLPAGDGQEAAPVAPGDPAVRAKLQSGERGFIEFGLPDGSGKPRRFDIHLLETADETTLAHELAHFFGESLHDIATQPDAPAELRADYETLVRFMGYGSAEERGAAARERVALARQEGRTAEQDARLLELTGREEKLSHAWEQYLAEGKTPSPEMASVFQRFALWARKVYRGVQGIAAQFRARFGRDLELSDDVRRVFDRLISTDEEIRRAQGDVTPDPAPDSLSPEDRAAYAKAAASEADQGRRMLLRRIAQDQARETTKWFKAERERLRGEVEQGLDADPTYRALAYFQEGEARGVPAWVDAELRDADGRPLKLDREALLQRYGPFFVDQMPKGVVAPKGSPAGVDADFVAQKLGFETGDAMLDALRYAKPRKQAVAAEVERRMAELYGPALVQDAERLRAEALDAVHNEAGAEKILVVMGALRRTLDAAARRPPVDREAMKRTAERLAGEKVIGDLAPTYYLNAERSAGRKAFGLAQAGKNAEALDQYEAQLFAREMFRAVRDQREAADGAYEALRRSATVDRLAALGKADPVYRDAHASILGAVGLLDTPADPAKVDAALAQAASDAQEIGFDPDLLRGVVASGKGWKDMTVPEALNVRDAVANLAAAARARRELVLAGKRQSADAFFKELGETLKNTRPPQPIEPYSRTAQGTGSKLRHLGRGLDALLTDTETLAEMIDGDNRQGPAHRVLIDARLEARAKETELTKAVLKPIRDAWKNVPKDVAKLRDQRVAVADLLPVPAAYADRIAPVYTRDTLWSLFLNWGNEGNRQRIRDGNGWTDANVERALSLLTPHETEFLQKVLDTIDSLYPELAKQYEARTGLQLPKVDASPIRIGDRTYRGGYFPLKYDSRFARQGFVQEENAIASLFGPNYVRPAVASSHTKGRLETVKAPVDLTWGTVPAHLAQVIHDISYRDWVTQAGRVLLDERWRMLATQYLGPERAKEFTPWLRDVANARADSAAGNASSMVREAGGWARSRLAVAAIGFNVPSLLAHTVDPWTTVADGVGARRVAYAYAKTMNPFGETRARALAASPELQYRAAAFTDNLRHDLARMGPKADGISGAVSATAFKLHEYLDAFTTTTAWTAAHDQALSDGLSPEDAAARADDVVRRSFPSHDIAEKAPILRTKNGIAALVTFYGYASKMYNLNRRAFDSLYRAWNAGDATPVSRTQAIASVAGKMMALAVAGTAAGFFAGRGPDQDEDKAEWVVRDVLTDPLNTIPLVGPMAKGALEGKKVDPRTAPELALLKTTFDRLADAVKKAREGDTTAEDKAWAAVETAIGAVGPVGQAHRTIGYAKDLYTGEASPRGALDVAGGLIYGQRQKQPVNPATALQSAISE